MRKYTDRIGIIVLGKLGLPMLSAFITRGFDPIGYDINEDLIKKLRNGVCPYHEPGLKDVIDCDQNWTDQFYHDIKKFLAEIDVIFIIVPTPTKIDIFDINYVEGALNEISKYKPADKSITCVITSTVNPGDCEQLALKYKKSGIGIVYSPEFIALGSVLQDMLNPDIVLLGGENIDTTDKIFSIYSRLYKSHPEYHRLSYFESETAKIAINTYITTKISYANTIGMFVESATNSRSSAQRVLNAIGGDSRIGRKYFKYGTSYGGPCFPRDNRALTAHLRRLDIDPAIPLATDKINDGLVISWGKRILANKHDAVVLVGVAYKPGTDFLEESFMIKIGKALKSQIDIFYVDPHVDTCEDFCKIESEMGLECLSKYKKPLVIINYNESNIEFNPKKYCVLKIWA